MNREWRIFITFILMIVLFMASVLLIIRDYVKQQEEIKTIPEEFVYIGNVSWNFTSSKLIVIYREPGIDNMFIDDKTYVFGYINTSDIYFYQNYSRWESDKKNQSDWWTSQGYNIILDDWIVPPKNSDFVNRINRIVDYIESKNVSVALPRIGRWDNMTKRQ